ncbi:MAG TPA: winged helix-turn-helix domain-containing protein, partial [Aggregatilineales bacterium]|nr:winged helix-turn-helix domain-containing protein [Aggregatilineales bacterium]
MPIVANRKIHFGPFELDAHAGELYKHGLKLKLQGHPIQILAMLLERPGELITREEIQQKLWPSESETFVDFEHGLNTAVRKLRQALGDEAETPQYIETLPRRGYRFVGEIAPEGSPRAPFGEALATLGDVTGAGTTPAAGESATVANAGGAVATGSIALVGETRRRRVSYRTILVVLLPVLLGIPAWMVRSAWLRDEPLQVISTKQLTFSGFVGYTYVTLENYRSIQTDGRRIYFSTFERNPLRSVSVVGGEETVLPTTLLDLAILHISPDGSYLLVRRSISEKGTTEAPLWLIATNGGGARRLGDIEAQDAAFAPDGKTIIFARGHELYLTDLQGSSPAKLADTPGHAFWLRWSPDGQRVRFSLLNSESMRITLWELGADRKLRPLLKDWNGGQQACCGIWTGDGKYFLFSSNNQYWYVAEPGGWPNAKPKALTASGLSVTAAAANPLGKEVFISATSVKSDVFLWDLKANRTTPLNPELRPMRVQYSGDGQQIAYTKYSDPGIELWLAKADGSDRRQIVGPSIRAVMARFSPDGRKLAFMARRPDGPWKIYWVAVEGGAWHEIPGPPLNQADPNWSPDGQSILFGQPPESFSDPGVGRYLYQFDLRTGKTTEVAGSAGLFSPRWSPDGRYVAAMSIDLQRISVWDVSKSGWRPLVTYP